MSNPLGMPSEELEEATHRNYSTMQDHSKDHAVSAKHFVNIVKIFSSTVKNFSQKNKFQTFFQVVETTAKILEEIKSKIRKQKEAERKEEELKSAAHYPAFILLPQPLSPSKSCKDLSQFQISPVQTPTSPSAIYQNYLNKEKLKR